MSICVIGYKRVSNWNATNMTAFWSIASCILPKVNGYFRDAYCLHHQGDDAGSTHLWKVVGLLQRDHTTICQKALTFIIAAVKTSDLTLYAVELLRHQNCTRYICFSSYTFIYFTVLFFIVPFYLFSSLVLHLVRLLSCVTLLVSFALADITIVSCCSHQRGIVLLFYDKQI
jgi:hypothetical protein